jgi:predicted nucleic acid-binding Zn ribbon protein
MGRRAPRPLALALRGVRERSAPKTPLAAVQAVWREAVGEPIAAVASPLAERDGVVTIACSSAVWASELELRQRQLLARLRDRIGEGAPRGLKFVVGS